MIVDCEVAICYDGIGRSPRYIRTRVGVVRGDSSSSNNTNRQQRLQNFLMIRDQNKKTHKFRLCRENVTVYSKSFRFVKPSCLVLIRHIADHDMVRLKEMVTALIQNRPPLSAPVSAELITDPAPFKAHIQGKLTDSQLKRLDNGALRCVFVETTPMESVFGVSQLLEKTLRLSLLTELSLVGCGLKKIPFQLSQLKQLKHLNFSHNEIRDIPMWFCQEMRQLQVLNMSHNYLTTIPFEFYLLNCAVMNFSSNRIWRLPSSFLFKLMLKRPAYDRIDFRNNQINHLPPVSINAHACTEMTYPVLLNPLVEDKFAVDLNKWIHLMQAKTAKNVVVNLSTLAIESLIKSGRIEQLFNWRVTPKIIYDELQQMLFICSKCFKPNIRYSLLKPGYVQTFSRYIGFDIEIVKSQNLVPRGTFHICHIVCTECQEQCPLLFRRIW